MSKGLKIGVLAMQGAFLEHIKILEEMGVEASEVRTLEQLSDIDALIIPGGESTTIGKMLREYGMLDPLRKMIGNGFPVMGTCAGMIMLSENIEDGLQDQPLLGGLNILACRNAYGRQVESFEAPIKVHSSVGIGDFNGVFIRAPRIKSTGKGVAVLAFFGEEPVAVRQENIMALSFHPELTGDFRFHEYFLKMAEEILTKKVEKVG